MLSIIRLSSITLLCTFVLLFFSIQPCGSASEESETAAIEQQAGIVSEETESPAIEQQAGIAPEETESSATEQEEGIAPEETESPAIEQEAGIAPEEKETSEMGQETIFYYTVKKGDTLWDISNHFFDSPRLWPELWSKNNQILNPHLIYPGNRIRIYKKDGVIMITQVPEEEPVTAVEAVKEEAPVEAHAPLIPPAPPAEVKEEKPEIEESVFIDKKPEKEPPFFEYTKINSIGFIREKPAEAYAYIYKMKGDKTLLSEDDIVYLKQKDKAPNTLVPGSLYSIFEILEEPIKDNISEDYVGMQHNLKGVVEITEILQKDPMIAEGRITNASQEVRTGDLLMPYKRRSPKITLTQSPEGVDGKILVTQKHESIFADNTIAFIDKGEQDGILPGQRYSIYYTENLDEIIKKVDIGSIIVLHIEKATSTVFITDSDKALEPGVKIRTPLR